MACPSTRSPSNCCGRCGARGATVISRRGGVAEAALCLPIVEPSALGGLAGHGRRGRPGCAMRARHIFAAGMPMPAARAVSWRCVSREPGRARRRPGGILRNADARRRATPLPSAVAMTSARSLAHGVDKRTAHGDSSLYFYAAASNAAIMAKRLQKCGTRLPDPCCALKMA